MSPRSVTSEVFILYLAVSPSGKRYIGITSKGIADRWWEHMQEARAKRSNRALHNAIRKYGAKVFVLSELDRADNWQELCEKERTAIAKFGTLAPAGYNMTAGGDGFRGKHSDVTRQKMRLAHLGKVKSAEHRQNLRIALTGRQHPPEVIRKILDTKRGKPLSEAQIKGLSVMHTKNVGRVPTTEHRQKIAEAHRGIPKPGLRGRPLSEERKAKISAANSGRPLSDKHRAKLRAAWVLRRARRSQFQQELFHG